MCKVYNQWVLFFAVIIMFFSGSKLVFAADSSNVVGSYTGEGMVSVYVKDIEGNIETVTSQIGTKSDQEVEYASANEMENPAKTLILVDNSLSISSDNRSRFKEFIKNYADDLPKGEVLAIDSISDQVNSLIDFTDNRSTLKAIAEQIEFIDQETYLTDVLYELLMNERMGDENCFRKIIILSDGVDNKSIGYTKNELYSLVTELDYPIYTLGSLGKKTGKNEELENMFALSRMTGAKDYICDEMGDMDAVVDEIIADSAAYCFNIHPEASLLDGSTKNIVLTIDTSAGTYEVEAPVKMPQVAELQETEAEVEESDEQANEEEAIPPIVYNEPSQEPEAEKTFPIIPVISGLIAGLLFVIIAAILLVRKSSNTMQAANDKDDDGHTVISNKKTNVENDITEILIQSETKTEDTEQTMFLGGIAERKIVLTNCNDSAIQYMHTLSKQVVIGSRGEVDIKVLDDKAISGRHCMIEASGDNYYLSDLDSANGTYLNGELIEEKVRINSGDIIKLGRTELRVEIQ